MKKLVIRKSTWWIGALAAPIMPLALAATCGSKTTPATSEETVVDPNGFIDGIKQISPSVDTAVTWARGFNAAKGETPVLPTGVISLEFVIGNYPTEAEAKVVFATQKVASLPSVVDPDSSKRFLWAFLKPSPGYKLVDGKEVFDLTNSSGIKSITNVVSEVTTIDPLIFLDSVKQIAPSVDTAVTWASGFNAAKGETPFLPTGFQSLEFVIGNYPMEGDALTAYATQKVLALPSVVDPDSTKRFLWAFPRPAAGYQFTGGKTVFNLTVSSGIKSIATTDPTTPFNGETIDPTAFLAKVVSIAPSNSIAVKWASGFNANKNEMAFLPTGYQSLEFMVGNYPTEEAAIVAYKAGGAATALPNKVDPDATKRFVWAILKPESGYRFPDCKTIFNLTNSSGIKTIPTATVQDTTYDPAAFASMFQVVEVSPGLELINGNVKWSAGINENEKFNLPVELSSAEFVMGNYPTAELARADYNKNKTTTLPKVVPNDPSERYLWLFVKPSVDYTLKGNQDAINITTTSKIRDVKGVLDYDPAYVNFYKSVRTFNVTGTTANPAIDLTGFTLLPKLKIQYSWKPNRIQLFDYQYDSLAQMTRALSTLAEYNTPAKLKAAVDNKELFLYIRFVSSDPNYRVGFFPLDKVEWQLAVNFSI